MDECGANKQTTPTGSLPGGQVVWAKAQKAFKRRDYERAATMLLALINKFGDDAAPVSSCELLTLAGVTLLRLHRTAEGVALLERAVKIAPDSGRAHYKLGLGYGRLKQQHAALAQFEKAIAIDPQNVEYLCRLGLQHRRMQKNDAAETAYRAALAIDPAAPDAVAALLDMQKTAIGSAAEGASIQTLALTPPAIRAQAG